MTVTKSFIAENDMQFTLSKLAADQCFISANDCTEKMARNAICAFY